MVDLEAFSPEKMRFKNALIIAEFCIYRRNGGRAAEAAASNGGGRKGEGGNREGGGKGRGQ